MRREGHAWLKIEIKWTFHLTVNEGNKIRTWQAAISGRGRIARSWPARTRIYSYQRHSKLRLIKFRVVLLKDEREMMKKVTPNLFKELKVMKIFWRHFIQFHSFPTPFNFFSSSFPFSSAIYYLCVEWRLRDDSINEV